MSAAIAQDLELAEKRSRVVDLAKTGMSYRAIAREVGYASPQSVANRIAEWAAETKPSPEATEELRKLQAEQIDALFEGLWPRRDEETIVDRLLKLMDRKARLMGLDLERNINVNVLPTAEQFAAFLEWDAPAAAIEGTATLITDGSPDA